MFAIHSIYFWLQPMQALQELWRVLKGGGPLALTLLPQEKWQPAPPADIFTLYDAAAVRHLLHASGFRDVRVETSPQSDKFPGVCVLGVK